jgi:hypothetical protein
MPASVTANPASALPGQVVGKPIRLPYVMLCTQGERFCGKTWVANVSREIPEKLAERRKHEQDCAGGLIVGTA